jgi:hypothetical protein
VDPAAISELAQPPAIREQCQLISARCLISRAGSRWAGLSPLTASEGRRKKRRPLQRRVGIVAVNRAMPPLLNHFIHGNCSSPVFPCEDIAAGPAFPFAIEGGSGRQATFVLRLFRLGEPEDQVV